MGRYRQTLQGMDEMTKRDIRKTIERLYTFYKGDIPIAVLAENMQVTEAEAKELLEEFQEFKSKVKTKPVRKKAPTTVNSDVRIIKLLRWFMLAITPFALGLSGYYNVVWLMESTPAIIAIVLGSILIAFGTLCFEAAVFLKRKKDKMFILFGILYTVLLIFSIMNTVASQYNTYIKSSYEKQEKRSNTTSNQKTYVGLEKNEKDTEKEQKSKEKSLANYQNIVDKLSIEGKENTNEYKNAIYNVRIVERELNSINGELKEIRKKKETLSTKDSNAVIMNVDDKPTVFTYLAKIFGVDDPDFIMFIFQVIPSVVLDVISSVSLYVFLFLGQRRKE
jgi:hypothetical protein